MHKFGEPNAIAIGCFVLVVLLTFAITWFVSRKQQQSAGSYYTGGGGISGFQNGLALAGDYMFCRILPGYLRVWLLLKVSTV